MSTDALLQRALDEIVRQREELAELRARDRTRVDMHAPEPIAIVGMGCRFPGQSDSPAAYWSLLDRGADGTCPVPSTRWTYDDSPTATVRGTHRVRRGGFLPTVDTFDATFFGISPREARVMDPQQRMLLETAWHALEHAGIDPTSLYGSATGVFVGVTCFDHAMRVAGHMDLLGPYAGTGSALNMIPGRLSFLLGLRGPSLAIDTACSSSLVALHVACQSIRLGDCEQALVGGVHLMLSPDVMSSFEKAHMLSPDGWCKTFDARADGYARGEGCGVVVLKRLSDARDAGDRILGVIRGSAVNQDGPSGGLTVPSGRAQQAVMQRALAQAGLSPMDIDYVEAHGTGTSLGDPIEIEALSATYGAARERRDPLLVGSAKTNIGHLEPAAGIAALAKVLLSFTHARLPMHRHVTQLNPHLAWDTLGVEVVTEARAWPSRGPVPRAGISAFGFSGTNAHVIVEAPPAVLASAAPAATECPQLLCLSAKSAATLRRVAAAWQEQLATMAPTDFAAACWMARTGRAHFTHRLALVAHTPRDAMTALMAWSTGDGGSCWTGESAGAAYSADAMAATASATALLTHVGSTVDAPTLRGLASAYVTGADIDWRAPCWIRPTATIDIPLYPFEPERHWLDLPDHAVTPPVPATTDLTSYEVSWVRDDGADTRSDTGADDVRPLAGRCLMIIGTDTRLVSHLVAEAAIAGATIQLVANVQALGDPAVHAMCTDYIVLPRAPGHATSLDDVNGDGVVELLAIVQTMIQDDRETAPHPPARCWVVTYGVAGAGVAEPGVAVGAATAPSAPSAMADAARAAAARVMALEHPEHFGRIIDLPVDVDAARAAECLVRELPRAAIDEMVAYRGEHRFVPRLRPLAMDFVAPARTTTAAVRADRSYLVTGGFGAIGMHVATALAKAGAGRLLLVGRRGTADPAATAYLRALTEYGADVVAICADVADAASMREALVANDDPARPLAGVFHVAGIGGVHPIRELSAPDVRAILHPKLRGAWVMHDITRDYPLEHFVLFSSIAGVWGSRGQFHYAAANAALDALAHHRHGCGLPAMAISWGPWAGNGMTSSDAAALLHRIGVQTLSADVATSWLLRVLSAQQAHVIVATMDWTRFRGSYEARGPKGLFADVPDTTTSATPAVSGSGDDVASTWRRLVLGAAPTQRVRLIQKAVTEGVQDVLGWAAATVVPADQGLFELGVDSLAALDLRTHLEQLLGTPLPVTLVFQYPTIDALTQCVHDALMTSTPDVPAARPADAPTTRPDSTDFLDALSDDEAEAMLQQTLATLHFPS